MPPRLSPLLFAAILAILLGNLSAAPPSPESLAFFENKVRPLLSEKCYSCHSSNTKKLKAGLLLDHGSTVLKGGDSGAAVVPGDLDRSLLIEAVRYANPDMQMPPKKKLADEQIKTLEEWVKMGAPWPAEPAPEKKLGPKEFDLEKRKADHWCWQPVKKVPPPSVRDGRWPLDPIDSFILARLEEKGLRPAPTTDKRTLIRRVTYDLIGLPPTVQEVEAFLADNSTDAYAKVVDRLLASPHFGERWARHWMDLVRYAESCGHEFDYPIPHAQQYRDYLIRAFNADVPYDQFVREHIAGDLLKEPRRNPDEQYNESIIGTGFWFLHEATHAPTDVRGNEAERVDNQIDVMSKTFLGVTVSCAKCHDHMFDAISTKDYYALAGYLQSSRRQEAMLDPGRKIEAGVAKLNAIAKQEAELKALPKSADPALIARLLLAAREVVQAGDKANLKSSASKHGVKPRMLGGWVAGLEDASVKTPSHPLYLWQNNLADGANFTKRLAQIEGELNQANTRRDEAKKNAKLIAQPSDWMATGHAFDNLGDDRLRGVLRSPTFDLDGDHVQLMANVKKGGITARLIIDSFWLEPNNGLLFRGTRINDANTDGQWRWLKFGGDVRLHKGRRAHVEIIDHGDGSAEVGELWVTNGGGEPAVEVSPIALKFASDKKIDSLEKLATAYGHAVKDIIDGKESSDQLAQWLGDFGLATPQRAKKLEALAQQREEVSKSIPAPRMVQAMVDGSPENEFVFLRGNHKRLGDEVPRHFLTALGGKSVSPSATGSGREVLASQVVDPKNPLTPRVITNRLWHHLLGVGIVPSTDDFGVLGQRPTHPQLLDHLATTFVEDDWSIKRQIRRIVLTRTYQMSSQASIEAEKTDPTNQWLHRARVKRLQGEAIRDGILATSGRLDRKLYGAPVPVNLTPFMTGRGRPGKSGPLDGAGRRSIYTSVKRNFLPPMMLAFDTPIPFSTMGRRANSNVPAQALILMNDPFVVGQAEVWAKRILESKLPAQPKVAMMYLEAFGRPPNQTELKAGMDFVGDSKDLAVWKDFAHALFNIKEFIYIE